MTYNRVVWHTALEGRGMAEGFDKKSLSEQDIRTKFITPAILAAGWDIDTQLREEYKLTAGRIQVRGKLHSRAPAKWADYALFHKPNIPIAIVEANGQHSESILGKLLV